jgi:hypothetical protein
MDDLHLNAKDQRFVAEYTSNGYDAVEAAKAAGLIAASLSPLKSRAYTHEIMSRPEISEAIDRMAEEFLVPYRNRMISQVVACLQIRALYDISWYINPDGTAKPIDTISPERRWAIDKVEPKVFGKNADVREVVYTLADKIVAQRELRAILTKKEGTVTSDDGMKTKMDAVINALKQGMQIGAQVAVDVGKIEKAPEQAMIPAPEQKTVLQSPKDLLKRLKNG